jgi:hypothetical protein
MGSLIPLTAGSTNHESSQLATFADRWDAPSESTPLDDFERLAN